MGKNAYYFSHDYNARQDPKILALKADYGVEGYGRFWVIVEMMAEQDDYKLKLNQITNNALAVEFMCQKDEAEKFIKDCIKKYELFKSDDNFFWSESLLRRMAIKDEKLEKKRKAGRKGARKRWNEGKEHNDGKQNDSTAIADPWQCHSTALAKNSKGKEIKEKESKEKEIKENNNISNESFLTSTTSFLSDFEKEILSVLKNINNYPFDYETDLEHIRELSLDYPKLNLLEEVKKWNTYKKDKPLKKNSNSRLQFRNFIKKANEWNKDKSYQVNKTDEKKQRDKRLKLQQKRADKYG